MHTFQIVSIKWRGSAIILPLFHYFCDKFNLNIYSRVRKRRKSIEDIQNQYQRILNLRDSAQSNYYNRVYGANGARGIAQRYIDNIEARMNRKGVPLNDNRRYTTKAPQYAYRYGVAASGSSNG